MGGEKSFEMINPELIDRIEKAAISAAREILSGRRIIDVEGPSRCQSRELAKSG